MILLLVFSISIGEITQTIERGIFQRYNRTVQVTFQQGDMFMVITKSGKKILIQERIPIFKREKMQGEEEFQPVRPGGISRDEFQIEKRNIGDIEEFKEYTIAYYDGKNFIGCGKKYFVSYILFGCHNCFLYVIEELHDEGFKLIGRGSYDHSVEFERSTRLPMSIKAGNKRYEISMWKVVEGFGRLPAEMEVWINDKKVSTRELKSITYPSLDPSFFTSKMDEISIEEH